MGGAYVRIRFKPQATAADITAFLERQQGGRRRAARQRIGFFRVRVADKAMSEDELARW